MKRVSRTVDDPIVREIMELAAAGGVALVTRKGETAFVDAKKIPVGWKVFARLEPKRDGRIL